MNCGFLSIQDLLDSGEEFLLPAGFVVVVAKTEGQKMRACIER